MTTLGTMVDRIADELARDDLKTQTEDAIRSAVNNYAGESWWFNEDGSLAVTLTSSLDIYSLPADFEAPIKYDLILSGPIILAIDLRTYEEISDWQTGASYGQPTDYCIFNQSLMLFPTPNASLSTVFAYRTTVSTLTTTTCTNAFMTYGEEMIRARARADIMINFLRDEAATAEYLAMLQTGQPFYSNRERIAYSSMRHRTTRRLTTGRLVGSNW